MNNEKFQILRKRTEIYYKAIKKIYCPALDDKVHFNASGFHHLRFSNARSRRRKKEQANKFLILGSGVEIVKKTTTIQEYRSSGKCQYFAFIAITGNNMNIRTKVIIRKFGKGKLHFLECHALLETKQST